MTVHPIPPVWNSESRVLILGSFPSVKSRETRFFYGHPQNRFWRILASLYEEPVPETVPEKRAFLLRHEIAVWDVIQSCDIIGSSDSSIRNVTPNDLTPILTGAPIKRVFVSGKTAERLYLRYSYPKTKIPAQALPSSSPANAAWTLSRLIDAWAILKE